MNKRATFIWTMLLVMMMMMMMIVSELGLSVANVEPSVQEIGVGKQFVTYLNVTPDTYVGGMQTNIRFNKSIIRIDSIEKGNLFTQSGFSTFQNSGVIDNAYGTVINIYECVLGMHPVNTPGTFIKIYGTSLNVGTSPIELYNILLATPDGIKAPLTYVNGSITVIDPQVPIDIIGDINGDETVTVADALLYLRYSVGQDISPYYMDNSDDVTCDGTVTVADALLVLRKSVGQDVNLQC
jgi:hypothetical protein